ncbi:Crp/Fnr family transcriptional regulator [Acetobacter sp.]|uniref:Crp/Fnr family transcriptional regulator n=1 Tax=Acetobacter sp. TaxID=440 RepID=UPI0039E988FB
MENTSYSYLSREGNLASIASLGRSVFFPSNTTIFEQGSAAKYLYIVGEGVIRISRHLQDGQRYVMAFLKKGDICGVPETGTYLNCACTLSPTQLFKVNVSVLEKRSSDHGELFSELLLKTVTQIRIQQDRLIMTARCDVPTKVAMFLLDLCENFGCFCEKTGILTLPMPRSDIADYIGIAIESLSRALQVLTKQNVINRIDCRHLNIDVGRLRAAATP